MSCSQHAAHIVCELQSRWTTACNKHPQLLEKISQRHLTAGSKSLLLHFIKGTTLDSAVFSGATKDFRVGI